MLYCLYVLPTLNKAYLIWFDLIYKTKNHFSPKTFEHKMITMNTKWLRLVRNVLSEHNQSFPGIYYLKL